MCRPGLRLLIIVALAGLANTAARGAQPRTAPQAAEKSCLSGCCRPRVARGTGRAPSPAKKLWPRSRSGIAGRTGCGPNHGPGPSTRIDTEAITFRTRQAAASASLRPDRSWDRQYRHRMHAGELALGTAVLSPHLVAALSPVLNARYAALLLREYRIQAGSWGRRKSGSINSRNSLLAGAYRCRVASERSLRKPRSGIAMGSTAMHN